MTKYRIDITVKEDDEDLTRVGTTFEADSFLEGLPDAGKALMELWDRMVETLASVYEPPPSDPPA